MRALVGGVLLSSMCSAGLVGQDRDRSLERMTLALQQPQPVIRGIAPVETTGPRTLGIFTLVPPQLGGEMVRVSVPIGELVAQAFSGIASAKRRHKEEAARRRVEAALKWFEASVSHQPPP